MYLVELKPGKEELYRTGDDLAIAIRDGDVDARSRIYHRATAKWISITLHPQYKAIVAVQEEEERSITPARRAWGLLTSLASAPAESGTDAPAPGEAIRQRWKRPVALGLASLLLLLGVQLAFSGPRPPWVGQHTTGARVAPKWNSTVIPRVAASPRQDEPMMEDGEDYQLDMVSLASTHAGWPIRATAAGDTIAIALPPTPTVPALPPAPRLRSKALRAALARDETAVPMRGRSIESLMARYDAASHGAYIRLESGIRVARLNRLFAPGRLTPGGGVPDTRVGLAGAANFIRVYRQEQTAIDRAYQDSVSLFAKRNGWKPNDLKRWSSRPQRKESPTLELLSSSLLNGIDSILGVLDAQAGAYKLRGTAIAFENPAATEAYGALRRKIKEHIDAAVVAGGATSFGPTGLLLQAIGTSTLPRET